MRGERGSKARQIEKGERKRGRVGRKKGEGGGEGEKERRMFG